MFEGTSFYVIADHRSADDRQLLGHGLEGWSATGGTLSEVPVEARPYTYDLTDTLRGFFGNLEVSSKQGVIAGDPSSCP